MRQPGEPVHSKFQFENPNESQALQFIITAPKESAISNLSFDIDNFKKVKLPITLPAGHHFKYEGGNEATVYSPTWNKVRAIKIDAEKFEVDKGNRNLIFDCKFEGGSGSVVMIEMKTRNDGDKITL